MEPSTPTSHPTGTPSAHHALQLGLLDRRSHHSQHLSPKCRVCSWPLLQDLGSRQRGLALRGWALAWPGAADPRPMERQQERFKLRLMNDFLNGRLNRRMWVLRSGGPRFKLWLSHLEAAG